jgi:hypothetical protein
LNVYGILRLWDTSLNIHGQGVKVFIVRIPLAGRVVLVKASYHSLHNFGAVNVAFQGVITLTHRINVMFFSRSFCEPFFVYLIT